MKRAIVKKLFQWANTVGVPLVAGYIVAFYKTFPEAITQMLDPWALVTVVVATLNGLLIWGLSKWLGIPVKDFQMWLAEKGLYAGRIDGDFGPVTESAAARAVDDPTITTEGTGELVPAVRKFQRPQGSKML
jgi:hypothetical protein